MDSFNNPFIKLNIYVINANEKMIILGIEKIVIAFNKNEVTNYSQFIEKLNDIFSDYGIISDIYNKEGFKICEFNNLQINNIWNYIANNDIIQVVLNFKKEDFDKDKNIELNNTKNISDYKKSKGNNLSNLKDNKKEKKKNIIDESYSIEENSESESGSESEYYKKGKSQNNIKSKLLLNNIKNEKKLNDFYENNNNQNKNLLGKKRKQNNNKSKKDFSEKPKNNKIKKEKNFVNNSQNNSNIKKLNYELIPSDKLDDIAFLKNTFPKLFISGTNIKFKIQELLKTGIGVGDYHFGIIDNYNEENNSFLIKNCNSLNEKTLLFMYQCDEENLMSVELKNFVEIWIETEKNGKNYLEKDKELTKHFIRRQVEFYFCNKNYEKDNFLKKNEDDNGFIPIDVIMNFNKIQMITKDKNEFIEALKEEGNISLGEDKTKSYEFNGDFSKIRKIK